MSTPVLRQLLAVQAPGSRSETPSPPAGSRKSVDVDALRTQVIRHDDDWVSHLRPLVERVESTPLERLSSEDLRLVWMPQSNGIASPHPVGRATTPTFGRVREPGRCGPIRQTPSA